MAKEQLEKKQSEEDNIITHSLSEASLEKIREEYKSRVADGRVKRLILNMDDRGKEKLEVAALVPSRSTQDQFLKFIDKDPGKAQKILVRNCLLTNIDQVNDNDFLFNTCVSAISDLFEIGDFEIKNF